MAPNGYSFTRGIYKLSDERAVGLENNTLWKKGNHYIFNGGSNKGWSIGFKLGPNYSPYFTSKNTPLAKVTIKSIFVQKGHVVHHFSELLKLISTM